MSVPASSGTLPPSSPLVTATPLRTAASVSGKANRLGPLARPLLGLALPAGLLLIWEVAVQSNWVARHQLPPPSTLAESAAALVREGILWKHTLVSSLRVGAGFLAGAILGLLTGSLVALVRPAERLLEPTFQGLRAVPSLAWVPLLLLWLGIDESPKLVLIAIGAFFPVYLATQAGLVNVDRKLVEVGRQLGLSRHSLLWRILVPAALPSIFTGLRASLSLSWMFLVAAELIASTQGLGYLLSDGRETGRVDLVFIAILALALLGKLSDSLICHVERHVLAWRDMANLQENPS